MGCTRQQLNAFFDDLLTPQRFKDYCPNGLQVEGKTGVRHLVSGVTASQALIEAAQPLDYAPKKPDEQGQLSETFGLDKSNSSAA